MLHRLLRKKQEGDRPADTGKTPLNQPFQKTSNPLPSVICERCNQRPDQRPPKRQMGLSQETLADPPALATRPKKTGRLATTAPTTKGMSRLGKQKYVPLEPPSLPTIQIFAALRAIAMILAGRQSDRRHAGIASMQLGMTGPTVFGVPLCRPAGWVSAWRKMAAQSMKDAPVRR